MSANRARCAQASVTFGWTICCFAKTETVNRHANQRAAHGAHKREQQNENNSISMHILIESFVWMEKNYIFVLLLSTCSREKASSFLSLFFFIQNNRTWSQVRILCHQLPFLYVFNFHRRLISFVWPNSQIEFLRIRPNAMICIFFSRFYCFVCFQLRFFDIKTV